METIELKPEIMEKIKSDPILYGNVANLLGISPATMPRILLNNDARLTQANVLRYLKGYLKLKKDTDLLAMEAA